ncbi:hypothetical protein UFOVP368_2 [uncultured Caudovirales phage]|uniref:Uncharacterized protein n=1 Tax=uncultured Caudovirales phage TaxID=2100421 RepID=A0A6J7WX68_9CAUD|nr:hypothetical protein UFOVP368_2 [uncultured Caudovirales phage]
MDEAGDEAIRALSCDLARWFYNCSPDHPATIDEFLATAGEIASFISDGECIALKCDAEMIDIVFGGA